MDCHTCPALDEIRRELRALRGLLQPRRCTPADEAILCRILPAIAGTFGSSPVTVREVLADPAIKALYPGSKGSLGNLLSRAAADGAEAYGYCVRRVSTEHGAALWGVFGSPPPV
jgi:hypothetical protein